MVKPLITAKKAVGYAILPGLVPRISGLFLSGFGALPWYMALIMAMVRLLPADHPYLQRRFFGTYGVRHVLAAGAHHLTWSWKHADQILVYLAILSGTVIIFLYIASLIFFALTSPAFAGQFGLSVNNLFLTEDPSNDIAFIMMDRTLGIPGLFNSEVTTNAAEYGPFPNVTQVALHGLFGFYNAALFLIAIVIFLFMVIEVVLETTVTGKPFGQRFQNVWVPFRVVAALGLMIPITYGFSSAQWITLYVAKMGSGLATNAWIVYNTATGNNPTGSVGTNLVSKPGLPEKEYGDLTRQLLLIRSCMSVYNNYVGLLGQSDSDFSYNTPSPNDPGPKITVPGIFAIRGDESIAAFRPRNGFSSADGIFKRLTDFYQGGDIRLVAGIRADKYKGEYPGSVYPACGEIIIPSTGSSQVSQFVQEAYLFAVARLVDDLVPLRNGQMDRDQDLLTEAINRTMYLNMSQAQKKREEIRSFNASANQPGYSYCLHDFNDNKIQDVSGSDAPEIGDCTQPVPAEFWQATLTKYKYIFSIGPLAAWDYYTGKYAQSFDTTVAARSDFFYTSLGQKDPFEIDTGLLKYGWGGAGVWYNRIAEVNGHMITAVFALPTITRYPDVMQRISGEKAMTDSNMTLAGCTPFNPSTAAQVTAQAGKPFSQFEQEQADVYYKTCQALIENEQLFGKEKVFDDGNPILRGINAIFGTSPIFNFRQNAETHPLAALSALGKSLIEKAVSNLTISAGAAAFGGLSQIMHGMGKPGFKELGEASYMAAKMFVNFAFVGLSVGVLLYYVIPFMPFMYFFFAVGRWVKTIFEALVGVPLWAIAHLKLGGEGFPGKEASSGYFLLLEIFIRPVLTVFSLIAAFAVFSGSVATLNGIFDLVTGNITGVDRVALQTIPDPNSPKYIDNAGYTRDVMLYARGVLDQFFYTVMYIILVYMIGTASFKLIDLIPDGIMRWSGAGVQTFGPGDIADDHVDNVGSMVAIPTFTLGKKMADDAIDAVYKIPKSAGDILSEQNAKNASQQREQKLADLKSQGEDVRPEK